MAKPKPNPNLLSAAAAVAGKDDRLVALVLVYERRVLKVRDERDLALDARVGDLAHLVRGRVRGRGRGRGRGRVRVIPCPS